MMQKDDILVGRYKIIKHLSSKGSTQSYLAEDVDLPENPHCVVKQLRPGSLDPDTLKAARELFETEAKVLDKLGSHDKIPSLLAYFEENQEFYLVEEFIDGEDLEKTLAHNHKLSEEQVISLLQDTLGVLQFVHQKNVIHREIQPSNIIRRYSDSKIVLTGFSAVKQVHTQIVTSDGETSFTRPVGTKGYMPNEQQGGKPRLSSDIYALGITAIQALTGIHPNKLPEDPRTGEILWRTEAQVRDRLAAILDKMVKSHYRDRYQSADEVLHDLDKISEPSTGRRLDFPSGVNTSNGSYSSAIERQPSRRKLLIPASIGALVVILGGITFVYFNSRQTPIPSPRSQSTSSPTKTPTVEPKTAEEFVTRGNQRLESGEYKEALADFDQALQLQSNSSAALSGKNVAQGRLFLGENKPKEALAAFEKAIAIQPDNPRGWEGKGDIFLNASKFNDALAAYNKATQVDPNYALGWVSRGLALSRLEKYSEAIVAYDKAIAIDDTNSFTWYQKGVALASLEKYQDAVQSYDKAIEINPNYQDAWIDKGKILFYFLGKREEGLEAVDKAIEIDSSYIYAWIMRGEFLSGEGRHEAELAAFEKALSIDPENFTAWQGKSQALVKLRRLDEAIAAAQRAIDFSPNIPLIQANSWTAKANALYESGKYNEALPAYKKAIELAPEADGGWSNLSELLNRIKRYDEALVAAENSLKIESEKNLFGWNQKSNALLGLKKYLDAIASYDQVLKIKPDYHYAWIGKGNAFYNLGKYQDAVDAYDKALDIIPKDRKLEVQSDKYDIWNRKGNALFAQNKYQDALAAYEEATKIKTDFAEGWFNQGKTLAVMKKFPEAIAAYDKALAIKTNFTEAKIEREKVLKHQGK